MSEEEFYDETLEPIYYEEAGYLRDSGSDEDRFQNGIYMEIGRKWFRDHPGTMKHERMLTPLECRKSGYPFGTLINGIYRSDGSIIWKILVPIE